MPFSSWSTFYEVIGSSAGALVGIQFVVMALIASLGRRTKMEVIDAFGTPTVCHFCGALIIAAVMCAPWPTPGGAAIVLGTLGAVGVGYEVIVIRRTHRQKTYRPELYDWLWYVSLPTGAYVATAIAAACLPRWTTAALFTIASVAIILLLVGIHNSWDTVTYIVTEPSSDDHEADRPS